MKSIAMDKHSSLVICSIGGKKKSFKIFARGFARASTFGANSLSHKY
jgi:hypothetical protein